MSTTDVGPSSWLMNALEPTGGRRTEMMGWAQRSVGHSSRLNRIQRKDEGMVVLCVQGGARPGVHAKDHLRLQSCSRPSKGDPKSRIFPRGSKKGVEVRGHFVLSLCLSVLLSLSVERFRVGVVNGFFQAVESETEAKYTGPFIKGCHSEEREEEKRQRQGHDR